MSPGLGGGTPATEPVSHPAPEHMATTSTTVADTGTVDDAGPTIMEVRALAKRYGRDRLVLRDVSFEVHAGEIVGLVGPNGVGKTTTLAIAAGLIGATAGGIWHDGRRCPDRQPRPWLGAWVGEPGFYGHLTGAAHLRATAGLRGVPLSRADAVQRLAEVGLDRTDAGRKVRTYSTGMRRRLAFATATAGDIGAVLLDEPTSGLDPEGIRLMLDRLVALAGRGVGVVLSSHRLGEVESICDAVVLIHQGVSRPLQPRSGEHPVVRVRPDRLDEAQRVLAADHRVLRLGRVLVVADTRLADIHRVLAPVGVTVEWHDEGPATLEEMFLLSVASGSGEGDER